MSQEKELDPLGSARQMFGARLRRMRKAKGWSLDVLEAEVPLSKSQLARVERGAYLPPEKLPALLDDLFGTEDLFAELYVYACREAVQYGYGLLLDHERRAIGIKEYAGVLIPGLLQTEGYARALFRVTAARDEAWQEEQLAIRMARQTILRGENPPHHAVLLDEAAIRRPIGGPAVMREQLEYLITMVETPLCVIQLLPFSYGGHGMLGGAVHLLTMPDNRTVAYEESTGNGTMMEAPDRVQRHVRHWDRLWAYAMRPQETAALLRQVIEELPGSAAYPADAAPVAPLTRVTPTPRPDVFNVRHAALGGTSES
ncbi:Scr1 family TA system antitoxin-like transcriptional regulator [Streptomyces sp. KE1]|uniref:helix-turn-helix domain-containing protein n=1 Tax=Streptomyces sp. KE1 TaxID=1638939 RepID=UPI00063EA038|nr:Scr1 family TA system antitoxin-like transcriptional regulator [Streptomyces sp. KE1]KLJ04140.1 DNA-binding protein [Streptomyces sp. KE1]